MYEITREERNSLFEAITELLNEYDYYWESHAINKIIDEWLTKKGALIELFKKHPNYIDGKYMIAYDIDVERKIDTSVIGKFFDWIITECMRNRDYIEKLPDEVKPVGTAFMKPEPWELITWDLVCISERTLNENYANKINKVLPNIRAKVGEKTCRVVNRICRYLGYDKHPDYNREYAKYADALSPVMIKRHTVLSIHPVDYLTMSFGNSWASCHTIDKCNKRRMPNNYEGCYSSGTISYMLDNCSMVLYVVDSAYKGSEYYLQPKVNRQMYHYANGILVQGRLYPQNNDGAKVEYTTYRQVVHSILSACIDAPNLWSTKHGTEEIRNWVDASGTHYRDYFNFDSCTISFLKEIFDEDSAYDVEIGAEPICIECGDRHDCESNINCCRDLTKRYTCADCGCTIDEDDVVWIDDEPYCRDCVSYCDYCGEYVRGDVDYIDGRYVCEYCVENHFTYCDECHEWHENHEMEYIDGIGDICYSCLSDNYTRCEPCGEWMRNEDAHEVTDEFGYTYWYCDECYEEYERTHANKDESEDCENV